MEVQFEERTYDIRWEYWPTMSKVGKDVVIRTTCFISSIDPNKKGRDRYRILTSAFVIQNPNDKHNKSKARKLSLAKMLLCWIGPGETTKPRRKHVWNAYFEKIDRKTRVK